MSGQLSFFDAQAERDRILAHFAEHHRQYIEAVRAFARDIARRDGVVCIDAVRYELERREFPLPADVGIDARVFGTLFRCKEFIPVSQRPTQRAERIGRAGIGASYITVYRLAEAA